MNVRALTSEQLHKELTNKVSREREMIAEIVEYIHEVDRRRLYLRFNHTSLFDYLVKEMKYSAGSAQRRINAARMLTPQLKKDLQSGEITLTQVAAVAHGLKQAKREIPDFTSTVEVKRDLLEKVKCQPLPQAQQIVAQALNLEVKAFEKKIFQRDESLRLEVTFTKEEVELLNEVKDLLSHSHPGASYKDVLIASLQQTKRTRSPVSAQKAKRARNLAPPNAACTSAVQLGSGSAELLTSPQSRLSKAKLRRSIFIKDKTCRWTYSNGQVCGSTFQLEVDHRKSRWLGGSDRPENLQILCSAHNRLKYRRETGLSDTNYGTLRD